MNLDWNEIRPDGVCMMWQHLAPYVQQICDVTNGRMTLASAFNDLGAGHKQLWIVHDKGTIISIVITQVTHYASGPWGEIVGTSGKDMKEWHHMRSVLEHWAKSKGCLGMMTICHPGIERYFSDYEKTHVFLEKTF